MIPIRHCQETLRLVGVMALSILMTACGGESAVTDDRKDILVKAGEKTLTLQDVLQKIPTGIEPADSASLFKLIIDNWIKSEVLSNFAESKLPDISGIDDKVSEYRNRLIVAEYLNEIKKSSKIKVNEDSIRYYYDRHKNDMLTETPLVKGIYLKIGTSTPDLDQIKQLVFCGSDECIDNLEQLITSNAVQYDYFMDDWIDWQLIEDQIPHRFSNPDEFLKLTKNFDTSYNGSTYILHVSDYLPSGSVPPYEFAAPRITELLERTDIQKYEETLVKSLIKKALKDGDLVAVGYNPVEMN